jgi:hypothetical protein
VRKRRPLVSRRNVQSLEIVQVIFNLRAIKDLEAHRAENGFNLLLDLCDGVDAARGGAYTGGGDINPLFIAQIGKLVGFEGFNALGQSGFNSLFGAVDPLPGF